MLKTRDILVLSRKESFNEEKCGKESENKRNHIVYNGYNLHVGADDLFILSSKHNIYREL